MAESNEKLKKLLKFILKLGVTALALFIVFRKVDLEKLGFYFQSANWFYFFLAALTFFLSKVIASFRLNLYYGSKGLLLSRGLNLRLYLLSMFYNLFLPGGIGGEGYKVYWLNKNYKAKVSWLIWASLHDRVNGLVALLMLALLCFPFITYELDYKYLSVLLIPIMYLVYWLVMKKFFADFSTVFVKTNLYSVVIQLMQIVCVHLVMMSLGITDNIINYWFIFLVATIAFALPITIGGVGAREVVFLYGAEFLGLDQNLSVTISLMFYLGIVLSSFTGIYYLAFPQKMNTAEGQLQEKPV